MAAASPTRSDTPNAHPYPIKTTATGILTRSNSSSAHGSWSRHRYSPAPPSPKPGSERNMSESPSPSKHSRSWTGRTPAGERVKLPRHPYLWTPAHLGTYLAATLHDADGEPLSPDVVQRIVEFVRAQKIGGRAFLSLDQEDFQEMDGVDATWADALWDAACTLRVIATPYRPSRVSSGVYKRGRVRGIVGVFERSASESSDVGEDDAPRSAGSRRRLTEHEGTTEDRAEDDLPAPRSEAPTPRPSLAPGDDHDRTPQTREVEIASLRDAGDEPTIAELYERTYGVPAPPPRHRALHDDEDVGPGETVKITVPESSELPGPEGHALLIPVPSSLADLFVSDIAPISSAQALESHPFVPGAAIADPPLPQRIHVSPRDRDEAALRALDRLKARLERVEDRIATVERKRTVNGYATHDTDDGQVSARWGETRQSAYVLLAGVTAGVSFVIVPLLFRHFWTR